MQPQGVRAEGRTVNVADEEEQTAGHEDASGSSGPVQGKKNPPEQRRRVMSDRFMMFTYKIKMCKRQDLHNWRLCPYAHPGEAGKRRPPHTYQAVMCDFSKTRKECSHGEACLQARNALEYWLHPDKYRTKLCGHGEACNRNICFFAHNQQELRMPSSRPAAVPSLAGDPAAAAAEAFQQLSLSHLGAGSSSQAAAGQHLLYTNDPAAGGVAFQAAAAAGGGLQQPMQAMQVIGPTGAQQQVLVPVQVVAADEQQQMPIGVAAAPGVMATAAGLQHVQYQQALGAGSSIQTGAGATPGLTAAGMGQPGIVAVGHPCNEGQQQLAQQQQQQQNQQEQSAIAGQSITAGSSSHSSAQVHLQQQQQPVMPRQNWGDAAAGQYHGMHEGGPMAHVSYYGVPVAPVNLAGQTMVPAMQQQQVPHVQQAQQVYYQPPQPQVVMYAPADPGGTLWPPSAVGHSGAAMGYVLSNPGQQRVQILLSQQPAALHAAAGMVPVSVLPVSPLEQASGQLLPPTSASADAIAHYRLPQQW